MSSNAWRERLASRLIGLRLFEKRALAIAADTITLVLTVLIVATLAAPSYGERYSIHLGLLFLAPALTIPALWLVGVYRAVVRFSSLGLSKCVARGFGMALLFLLAVYAMLDHLEQYWNLLALYAIIGSGSIILLRLSAARLLHVDGGSSARERVVIYGAGEAGVQLATALLTGRNHRLVGFVDDRSDLHGRMLMGVPVYAPERLSELRGSGAYDRVLLAIPSATRSQRRQILEFLEPLSVPVMVMPGLDELAKGEKRVDELREVRVEDLLGRDPVPPIEPLIKLHLRGRNVLVTGAGGSIGSQLCRQALKWGARRLVLFEVCELSLYQIEADLRPMAQAVGCELVPVLGNVAERRSIRRALAAHQIHTLYHAAAYKHVPLVEQNIIAAVRNNIFGTLCTVLAARDAGVANLVLISTDKAVRPSSVMGASKRVCELIVQAEAAAPDRRQMGVSIVRFGNVLGSSGSVIPLFRKQIRRGGPITVTHPNVTRYFMTVQEAVELVIQAGTLGGRGEVFVLDMGEPVRIVDLAERMIRLSGLEVRTPARPDGDIAIEFTGLRPGEKLYEELLIGKNLQSTSHPCIFKAYEFCLPRAKLGSYLHALQTALVSGDQDVVRKIIFDLAVKFSSESRIATLEYNILGRFDKPGGQLASQA